MSGEWQLGKKCRPGGLKSKRLKQAELHFATQLFSQRGCGGVAGAWGRGGGGGGGQKGRKRTSPSNDPMVFSRVKSLRVLRCLGERTKENVTCQGQRFLTLTGILALGA